MKKTLTLCILAMLVTVPSFARYVVVLRDGTRYAAKAKWTIVNGKALVQLENGQSLSLDPGLIDEARSEQATKVGMANAAVLDLNTNRAPQSSAPQQPSLGDTVKLRRGAPAASKTLQEQSVAPRITGSAPPAPVAIVPGSLPPDVLDKFERAYDNLGIFERKLTSTGARSIRAELTIDTEDRVFNAISATSFLMMRNAGAEGVQIDMVELYMKTTTGGAAGRFQMSRADAEALDKRTISQQEYFVKKVIY